MLAVTKTLDMTLSRRLGFGGWEEGRIERSFSIRDSWVQRKVLG
jgi:hypothetical protein